jgi:hypothetical protein
MQSLYCDADCPVATDDALQERMLTSKFVFSPPGNGGEVSPSSSLLYSHA